jgi:hypothetical protein
VKVVLEHPGNMGIINPALGSNFPTEAIMKIVKITQFCLQREHVLQPTMSDVMVEINDALQLEGQKGEESPIKIEIPQCASQSETNPKGKTQQQLETSNARSHGSSEPGRYTFMEVMEMTDGLANQIGISESGILYHGKLPTGQEVAVKVWGETLHSAAKEFSEFEKVRSPNV